RSASYCCSASRLGFGRPGTPGLMTPSGRGSRGLPERGPGPAPRRPQPGGEIDRRSLLVVVDAEAVPERGDAADVGELAAEQSGVDVHRDRRGVSGGRRAPDPEVVGAAVDLRQAVAGAVVLDRSR